MCSSPNPKQSDRIRPNSSNPEFNQANHRLLSLPSLSLTSLSRQGAPEQTPPLAGFVITTQGAAALSPCRGILTVEETA